MLAEDGHEERAQVCQSEPPSQKESQEQAGGRKVGGIIGEVA